MTDNTKIVYSTPRNTVMENSVKWFKDNPDSNDDEVIIAFLITHGDTIIGCGDTLLDVLEHKKHFPGDFGHGDYWGVWREQAKESPGLLYFSVFQWDDFNTKWNKVYDSETQTPGSTREFSTLAVWGKRETTDDK